MNAKRIINEDASIQSAPKSSHVTLAISMVAAFGGWNMLACALALVAANSEHSLALLSLAAECFIQLLASAFYGLGLCINANARPLPSLEQTVHGATKAAAKLCFPFEVYITCCLLAQLFGLTAKPHGSYQGAGLCAACLLMVPLVVGAQTRMAVQSGNDSLRRHALDNASSVGSLVCAFLGLVLNAALHWWWADFIAAAVVARSLSRDEWKQENLDRVSVKSRA